MAELVPGLGLAGGALVVDDDAELVARALVAAGVEPHCWYRRALHGHSATAWAPEGCFEAATIRLPQAREVLEMLLHAAASRLGPGGRVFVYGTNDEGIRSAARKIEAVFGATHTLDTRAHSRALGATRPEHLPGLRAELDDWRRSFSVELPDGGLPLVSYPGVFAHGRLDAATRMLIDVMPTPATGARVLDFGCGVGVLGAVLRRRAPTTTVELLDAYALAVEAARINVPEARVLLGDGWDALPAGAAYDLVVSNPPIHTGVGEDYAVLADLVQRAPAHLARGGELWLVVQRTVPVQELLRAAFAEVEVAAANSQFRVFRACAPR
jgi:16S rRNA (guanine1207-N2)-methyltransferase